MIVLSDKDMSRLSSFVRDRFGVDLERKKELVASRLSSELESLGYERYSDFLNDMEKMPDGSLCQRMIDRLSTNHTYFYREMNGIKHLCEVAAPHFVSNGSSFFRIWSCASSSGQECYTIAMELEQIKLIRDGAANYSIYASDVNAEVLKRAKLARYPISEISHIPAHSVKLFCEVEPSAFTIVKRLQNRIVWEMRNLMEPFDNLGKFDAVFCRNVMFYFNKETRNALVRRLYDVIKPGGFLYIGMTETIDPLSKVFDYVAPSIYMKRRV